jgi:hypothetical protein
VAAEVDGIVKSSAKRAWATPTVSPLDAPEIASGTPGITVEAAHTVLSVLDLLNS